MTAVGEFTVNRTEYQRRNSARRQQRRRRALTSQRLEPWTEAEDAIVLRDDLLMIEKVAMLQRGPGAIASRITRLRRLPAACSVCGSEYQPRPGRANQACSFECAVVLRTTNPVVPCSHCGVTFRLKFSGLQSSFCSWDCYRAFHLSARARTCQHCGVEFFHARAKSDQRHCSVVCEGAARAASHTHCGRGHEYTPENTYITPSTGSRKCRACEEHYRRARGVAVGLDTEARAARLARWAELGKTYDAVAVLAAESGVTEHAIKDWLKRHGNPAPKKPTRHRGPGASVRERQ